jgi:Tol biopolymer transport system component
MPDLDQRIRSGLDRLSVPVEPQDAFERIAAKKRRRRVMHRAQTTALPFVALVFAAVSTFGLVRAFHRSPPATTPAGSPVANGRIAFVIGEGAKAEVYTVEPDGSGMTRLVDGRDSAWSPDGTRIAFRTGVPQRDGGDVHIMVANADGSDAHSIFKLPVEPGTAGPPTWSPDGRRIAFANIDGIYVVGADGEHPHRITTYEGQKACYDLEPTWSPDGGIIAFAVRCDGGEEGVWAVQADGSDRHRLRAPSASIAAMAYPTFSPDGTEIAFSGVSADFKGSVYVMNADGSDLRALVDDAFWGSPVAWSPDGSQLAFARARAGGGIDTMNTDGTGLHEISADGSAPAWQPLTVPSVAPTAAMPTPTLGVLSDAVLLKEIGPACDVSKVTGDFDGDGFSDVAVLYFAPPLGGDCSVAPERRQYEAFLAWASGGIHRIDLGVVCGDTDVCRAFAAPDLDSDGKDELAIEHHVGASTAVLDFWTFRPDAHVTIEPGGPEHVSGAQSLTLVWGAAATHMDRIDCAEGAAPSVVAVSSQLDQSANMWRVAETVFQFDGLSKVVLEPTSHRSVPADGPVPSLEPGTRICGAPAGGEDLDTSSK